MRDLLLCFTVLYIIVYMVKIIISPGLKPFFVLRTYGIDTVNIVLGLHKLKKNRNRLF